MARNIGSKEALLQRLLLFRYIIVGIFVSVLLLFAIFILYLRQLFIKPIDRLTTAMRNVARGNFEIKLEEDSSHEFNFLFRSFNNMVFDLNYLKIDYYEEELKLQEAELKYLQSQINPHFFLNSLNIIYNLTVFKDYETIARMSLYLGNYLQFTINNENKLVTLEEEFKHIQNYLEIQCLRLPDKIDYDIKSEGKYNSVMIPPLTIQPFVENSIIHGMKKNLDKFKIEINVIEKNNGFLEIEIVDNGTGFSNDQLLAFHQRDFGKGGEHIGIWNVYKRLNLNFNDEVDLRFYNADNGGAAVKIIIPFKE